MAGKIIQGLNLKKQCSGSGLRLWQCPQFLFIVMGLVIIFTTLLSYWLGTHFIVQPDDPYGPYLISLLVISLSLVLLIISYIITNSIDKLAQASRLKSEFINIVSHQLRSPITNIKWIAEFLSSEDIDMTPDKKEEYFNHLKENTARMVELIDNLLIISKIEEGFLPLNKRESSLEGLVREVLERISVYATASNIDIRFNCDKNLKNGFFDSAMVKLAVENLIDNAIRYTKKGGKIDIYLEQKGRQIIFKVEDHGVGIPKQDQHLIFEKFFRSSNALKEQTRGSGLGLYIAKLIIKKSGGKIWFESEEGKGTTFYFILPMK